MSKVGAGVGLNDEDEDKEEVPPNMPQEPDDFDDEPEETHDMEEGKEEEAPSARPQQSLKKKQGSKREINPKFKDLQATGKWGDISKKEIYIAIGVLAAIVIAVVIVLAVVLSGGDDESPPASPAPAPTENPNEVVAAVREAVGNFAATADSLELLPEGADFYKDKFNDASQPPQVRAMSWVLYEDPRSEGPDSPWLIPRYALTTIWYATDGPGWTNQEGWLTEAHTCDWDGAECLGARKDELNEIDFSSNNLQKNIPDEVALLSDLRSIWLRGNQLSGNLDPDGPAVAFSELPLLVSLYLENNKFDGTIPEIFGNMQLSALFLQQNDFNGVVPPSYCDGRNVKFNYFGVDCEKNRCFCCGDPNVCFS